MIQVVFVSNRPTIAKRAWPPFHSRMNLRPVNVIVVVDGPVVWRWGVIPESRVIERSQR